ncbi:ATP-binding protein [Jannaschia sp. AI_61]|nr:ATP-binding protein [Jannaschia sp. AI_61]
MFLHRRFNGTAHAVRSHLQSIEDLARSYNIAKDIYGDVLIVLGEVLNNIVEHAFADEPDGWIDCKISRHRTHFLIETRDNGTPLPPRLLSAGALPDTGTDLEDLPEGGFGWFIVHTLTDDMIYERLDGQNHLSFSLAIS